MKNILKRPAVNAVCISVFSIFYAVVYIFIVDFETRIAPASPSSFWGIWCNFLKAGQHKIIACALVAITALVVILLIVRRKPYDEYHTALLTNCLAVASVLTLIAIAAFYLMILSDPVEIVEKFTLFITIHWSTVVLSDLAFVLLCRWR